MVLARWIPENVAISIIKYSVLTKVHEFFVVLFIFFCCLLIITKAEINGPTSGSCSWVNILEDTLFCWSLCTDYQIFSLLSIFSFPYFQSLWLRIFSWFWLQSSVLSIIFVTCLSLSAHSKVSFQNCRWVCFLLYIFSCGFCLLVSFRHAFRTFCYLDFFYHHILSFICWYFSVHL